MLATELMAAEESAVAFPGNDDTAVVGGVKIGQAVESGSGEHTRVGPDGVAVLVELLKFDYAVVGPSDDGSAIAGAGDFGSEMAAGVSGELDTLGSPQALAGLADFDGGDLLIGPSRVSRKASRAWPSASTSRP
ncbi:MAG TPA: hypothetical protein VFE61_11935 [Candidatus Sulfotelmatobacter sp.]|nr:hypothetical protein [Candidatus Sulfotelmatobacter sp.]